MSLLRAHAPANCRIGKPDLAHIADDSAVAAHIACDDFNRKEARSCYDISKDCYDELCTKKVILYPMKARDLCVPTKSRQYKSALPHARCRGHKGGAKDTLGWICSIDTTSELRDTRRHWAGTQLQCQEIANDLGLSHVAIPSLHPDNVTELPPIKHVDSEGYTASIVSNVLVSKAEKNVRYHWPSVSRSSCAVGEARRPAPSNFDLGDCYHSGNCKCRSHLDTLSSLPRSQHGRSADSAPSWFPRYAVLSPAVPCFLCYDFGRDNADIDSCQDCFASCEKAHLSTFASFCSTFSCKFQSECSYETEFEMLRSSRGGHREKEYKDGIMQYLAQHLNKASRKTLFQQSQSPLALQVLRVCFYSRIVTYASTLPAYLRVFKGLQKKIILSSNVMNTTKSVWRLTGCGLREAVEYYRLACAAMAREAVAVLFGVLSSRLMNVLRRKTCAAQTIGLLGPLSRRSPLITSLSGFTSVDEYTHHQGENEVLGEIKFDTSKSLDSGLEGNEYPLRSQPVDIMSDSTALQKQTVSFDQCGEILESRLSYAMGPADDTTEAVASSVPHGAELDLIFERYYDLVSSHPLPRVATEPCELFCALEIEIEGPLRLSLQCSVKIEDSGPCANEEEDDETPPAGRSQTETQGMGVMRIKGEPQSLNSESIKNEDTEVQGDAARVSLGKNRLDKEPVRLPRGYVSSFNFFVVARREAVLAESFEHQSSNNALNKRLGQLWRELSSEERSAYDDLAEADKMRYLTEVALYNANNQHARIIPRVNPPPGFSAEGLPETPAAESAYHRQQLLVLKRCEEIDLTTAEFLRASKTKRSDALLTRTCAGNHNGPLRHVDPFGKTRLRALVDWALEQPASLGSNVSPSVSCSNAADPACDSGGSENCDAAGYEDELEVATKSPGSDSMHGRSLGVKPTYTRTCNTCLCTITGEESSCEACRDELAPETAVTMLLDCIKEEHIVEASFCDEMLSHDMLSWEDNAGKSKILRPLTAYSLYARQEKEFLIQLRCKLLQRYMGKFFSSRWRTLETYERLLFVDQESWHRSMREAEWQSREPDFKSASIASNMSEESTKEFSMPLKSTYQQQSSALTSNEQIKKGGPKEKRPPQKHAFLKLIASCDSDFESSAMTISSSSSSSIDIDTEDLAAGAMVACCVEV